MLKVLAASKDYELALATNFLGGFWFYDGAVQGMVHLPTFSVLSENEAADIFFGLGGGVDFETLRGEQEQDGFVSLEAVRQWLIEKQKKFQAREDKLAADILPESDCDRLRASYGLPIESPE